MKLCNWKSTLVVWKVALGMESVQLKAPYEEENRKKKQIHVYILVNIPRQHYVCLKYYFSQLEFEDKMSVSVS